MKTLSLLTLATLITAFSGAAHAENVRVVNSSGGNAMLVTIKEKDSDEVKDSICIETNSQQVLQNYEVRKDYSVTAEAKDMYSGCSGKTKNTLSTDFSIRGEMTNIQIDDRSIEIR